MPDANSSEKIPREPDLPSQEELDADSQTIKQIGDSHHDRRLPPWGWNFMDHWSREMESSGAEDPGEWNESLGVLTAKALFVDDYVISEASGLARRLVPGRKMGVVLDASSPPPSAPNTGGLSFYGNVVHNGSHFLMFHRRDGGVGRAVSEDGITWKKDAMLTGIVHPSWLTAQGSFGGEMCVQYDPSASRAEEAWYAGVTCGEKNRRGTPVDGILCMLTSKDGISWKSAGKKWGRATDTYPCIYREGNDYTAIIRKDFGEKGGWREIRGVQVLKGRSADGSALSFDQDREWYLDLYGKDEWRRRSIYAITRTKHRGMYLGLAQVYEFPYGMSDERPFRTDIMQPYLVTSRDGSRFDLGWIRRKPLIPRGGPEEFDHGVILTAADWVTKGGYHWLYYSGWNAQHERKLEAEAKIGLIRWKQDRIVEVTPKNASAGAARLLTRALLAPPRASGLQVDAACPPGGRVSVRVLDAQSPAEEIASGVVGNFDRPAKVVPLQLNSGYSWRSMAKTPLRLEFQLHGKVSLYGFGFRVG